jgi:hypothetical protein
MKSVILQAEAMEFEVMEKMNQYMKLLYKQGDILNNLIPCVEEHIEFLKKEAESMQAKIADEKIKVSKSKDGGSK